MDTSNIKFIVLDVDGTLTDGGVYVSESGNSIKRYNAKDGMAMGMLREKGIEIGIISASKTKNNVYTRAKMLGLKYYYVGERPKDEVLKEWIDELNIPAKDIAYMGDDINDIKIMKMVGFSACPSDATPSVKEIADFVTEAPGGHGAFREVAGKYFGID